jgi:hypothetical protein
MGRISRAWTKLAPPGAMSPPLDLTRQAVGVRRGLLSTMFPRCIVRKKTIRFAAYRCPYSVKT